MTKQVFNIKPNKPLKKTYGLPEMYKYFKIKYPDEKVSPLMFGEVIERYNKLLVKRLFMGERVSLGVKLGRLRIKRVERRFKKPRIDWYETNKLKKETGISKYVYYTADFWLRFSWLKAVNLKNKTVYKFTPTKGCHGITKALAKYCREDPFAYDRFDYDLTREEKRERRLREELANTTQPS